MAKVLHDAIMNRVSPHTIHFKCLAQVQAITNG